MQKIADSAGVVVETIYRAFDGKAGLFKAAVEAAVAGGTAAPSDRSSSAPRSGP